MNEREKTKLLNNARKTCKLLENARKDFKGFMSSLFDMKSFFICVYSLYFLVDFFYGVKNSHFLSTITFHLGFIGVSLLSFRFKTAISILTVYNIFMSLLFFSSGHDSLAYLMYYYIFINWYGILRK